MNRKKSALVLISFLLYALFFGAYFCFVSQQLLAMAAVDQSGRDKRFDFLVEILGYPLVIFDLEPIVLLLGNAALWAGAGVWAVNALIARAGWLRSQ